MTKAEIIQWIKEYKRPIEDITEFSKQLVAKIKTMDFTSFNNGMAIGYAGSLDGNKWNKHRFEIEMKSSFPKEINYIQIYRSVNLKQKDRRLKDGW